jgi:single-stranded-DNA-specific exonuclease
MLRFVPRTDRALTPEKQLRLRPYTGVAAELLFARGIETAAEADAFLHPELGQLHDPFLLSGMREAVGLIADAKAKKLETAVYGDYDTDGICAASLLTEALRAYGVRATPYLPQRDDGYGLNAEAVEELAKTYRLLITVDLGITNADEVTLAKKLGMTVIVTDHHQPGLVPCPADAVLNPLLGGYPFPYLCGAGVAYKLAMALLGDDAKLDKPATPPKAKNASMPPERTEVSNSLLALAAVATIADIVSLTGENRVIAALGLKLIPERLGLRALMDAAGIKQPVTEGAVGFQLAPRLNAAGRVGDANAAVRLLLTDDPKEAEAIAKQLDAANQERKRLEQAAVNEADRQAQTHDFVQKRMLFVRGADWHKGVIGLVAGRLNRKYSVPVCALTGENGMLHGSLRGVRGVNLAACLRACDDLLVKYGGHEMAAGVTLAEARYEAFCARLEDAVQKSADPDAFLPAQEYDLALRFEDAGFPLLSALEMLRPYGVDNPAPVFYTPGVRLESRRACGAQGAHLQLRLRQNKTVLGGIGFGMGGEASALPDEVDAAYTLEKNEYRGSAELQCHVSALRPDAYARKQALADEEIAPYLDSLALRLVHQAGKTGGGGELYQSALAQVQPFSDVLLEGRQGTLYIAYTKESALTVLSRLADRVDVAWGAAEDPRCFHTLLIRPQAEIALSPYWRYVVLLDGALSPADFAQWREACPEAELLAPAQSPALRGLLAALDAGDDAFRDLFRLLRKSPFLSLGEAARTAKLSQAQTLTGLWAFHELRLIRLTLHPFSLALLPPEQCSLGDSPTLRFIRTAANEELTR